MKAPQWQRCTGQALGVWNLRKSFSSWSMRWWYSWRTADWEPLLVAPFKANSFMAYCSAKPVELMHPCSCSSDSLPKNDSHCWMALLLDIYGYSLWISWIQTPDHPQPPSRDFVGKTWPWPSPLPWSALPAPASWIRSWSSIWCCSACILTWHDGWKAVYSAKWWSLFRGLEWLIIGINGKTPTIMVKYRGLEWLIIRIHIGINRE